jgi:SprT protein
MDYLVELERAKKIVQETFTKLGLPHLIKETKVVWNTAFSATAGMARTRNYGNKIELAAKLWPHMSEEEQRNTIIHEACHVFANVNYRTNCKHGWRWKKAMLEMGIPAERCHNIPVYELGISNRRGPKARYTVKCGCSTGCVVGPTVYKRMKIGYGYRCKKCGRSLSI